MQQDIPIFKQKGFKLFLERCQRYLWISETVRQNVQSIPSNRSTITETSVRTNCFAWNIRNDEKSRRGRSQFHPSWNNRCWNKATWKVDRGCSQWRSQPKRSGWVWKVGLPRPLGEGFGEGGSALLPSLENVKKIKPILPSFHAI